MWDLSSPTRDQTLTPCTGSTESYPLDRQGCPECIYCYGSNAGWQVGISSSKAIRSKRGRSMYDVAITVFLVLSKVPGTY